MTLVEERINAPKEFLVQIDLVPVPRENGRHGALDLLQFGIRVGGGEMRKDEVDACEKAPGLFEGDESLVEAETHLHQAQTLTSEPKEQAMIETEFGEIAEERDQYEQALSHYRRVVDLQPDYPHGWYNVGKTYSILGQAEESIESYKQAISVDPDDIDAYGELVTSYLSAGRVLEARTLLEQGLERDPESAPLLTLLASTYFDSDPERADELLSEAESIEPDSIMVQLYRQLLEAERQKRLAGKQRHGRKRKNR